MARIGKADHARILQLVDEEQQKVSEVAAEYGCSPANLYALLGKLRRAARSKEMKGGRVLAEQRPAEDISPPNPPQVSRPSSAIDLFAQPVPPAILPARVEAVKPEPPVPSRPSATVTDLPKKSEASKRGGVGASLAKPGYGLSMRTEDSEETTTPFRSLEDVLSAVKPMLRAAARSQDPVWFSIRPIDLSEVEYDAA